MARTSLAYMFQEDLYQFTASIVVVLGRAWETYTSDERELLQKILNSVKVDINAVHIVAEGSTNLESLRPFAPSRVLIFGTQVKEDIPSYEDTVVRGFRVIRAHDLHELDDDRKKNLWLALRQMFGV